jgi:hypothetical protein
MANTYTAALPGGRTRFLVRGWEYLEAERAGPAHDPCLGCGLSEFGDEDVRVSHHHAIMARPGMLVATPDPGNADEILTDQTSQQSVWPNRPYEARDVRGSRHRKTFCVSVRDVGTSP